MINKLKTIMKLTILNPKELISEIKLNGIKGNVNLRDINGGFSIFETG